MEGWKGNLLNLAGKETMIKAVIQTIPTYIMSIVKLPKSFSDDLTSAAIKYWWSKSGNQKSIHWKRRSILCSPKHEGGMANEIASLLLSRKTPLQLDDALSGDSSQYPSQRCTSSAVKP